MFLGMRNSLFALYALLFTCVLPAQCFGTYPQHVQAAPGTPAARCNGNAAATGPGPWMSPLAAISVSTGGNLVYSWSDLPLAATSPASFPALIYVDVTALFSPAPIVPGPCVSGYVVPNIAFMGMLSNFAGCQGLLVATVPPLPGLAGVPLFSQGFMYDTIAAVWSTTNVSLMILQP